MVCAGTFCCAVLAVFDVKTGKIPNRLLLFFSAAGLAGSFALGGASGLVSSAAAAAGMFFLLWLLFSLRLMGAGDVKLFMMLGIYWGWPDILGVFAASVLAGGVYAAVRLLRRQDAGQRFRELAAYLDEVRAGGRPKAYFASAGKDARVSFAVFAAIGAAVCMVWQFVCV